MSWKDPRITLVTFTNDRTLLDLEKAKEEFWLPDIWVESLRNFQIHKSIREQAKIEMDKESMIYFWQR